MPLWCLLLLPLISSEDASLSIPPPIMPVSCHFLNCMPGMICRMVERPDCSSPPCNPRPECVPGESNEESTIGEEGDLQDPVEDRLGEHSTAAEEAVRRRGPLSALASNWTRGGSAPLLDGDTTKLMEGARANLMRQVMNQQPSGAQVGEFIVDLICLIRGTCQCNSNERYVTCGGCEGTCSDRTPSCRPGCSAARCECLPGFVRLSSVCIPVGDCPRSGGGPRPGWPRPWPGNGGPRPPGGPPGNQNCGQDEVWNACGRTCEPSCAVPNPPACPLRCRGDSAGCSCRSGYTRHWSGRCLPSNWCSWNAPTTTTTTTTTTQPPNVCPPYQRWMRCGSRCEYSCDNLAGCPGGGCTPSRCECIPGYVKWNNNCIPVNSCPTTTTTQATPTCNRNEVWRQCASGCEPSCYYPSQNCGSGCYGSACQCAPGYYRRPAPYNDCVGWSSCAPYGRAERQEECRENEVYAECTKTCEATCHDRQPKCSSTCGAPGCECSPGFLRVSVHESVCIPPEMCPVPPLLLWRKV